jgi:hypothetical protein
MIVEKRYLYDFLFKMNVITIKTIYENYNNIVFSSYLIESYDVWHEKLGHVNYNSMQRLIHH